MPLSQHGVITEEAMLAYLRGELSPENTTKFEQLIANDPFAREALEGLQSANAIALKNTFAEIKQNVAEKTGTEKSTKTISFSGFARYAVAAILVGALIGFVFLITNYLNQQSHQVALKEETRQAEPLEAAPLFEEKNENLDTVTTTPVKEDAQEVIAQENEIVSESISEPSQQAKTVEPQSLPSSSMSQPLVSPASVANQSAAKKGEERAVLSGQQDRATKEAKMKQTNFAGGVNPKPVNPSDADAGKQKNVASSEIISTESAAPSIGNEFGNDNIDKLPESMDAAMESFNNRNYKAAAKQFGKIADKDPTNLDAVYFEGISHFINGDNNKALKNFEKLLHKGAKHTDGAKWYKAQILLKKGKIEEAKKLLNELKETTGSFRDRAVNKLKELE